MQSYNILRKKHCSFQTFSLILPQNHHSVENQRDNTFTEKEREVDLYHCDRLLKRSSIGVMVFHVFTLYQT